MMHRQTRWLQMREGELLDYGCLTLIVKYRKFADGKRHRTRGDNK